MHILEIIIGFLSMAWVIIPVALVVTFLWVVWMEMRTFIQGIRNKKKEGEQ